MGSQKLTDAEIMSNVLEVLDISASKFNRKLGYSSPSTIYHVLNGVNGISTEMANRAVDVFPELNYMYLTRAEDPILLDRGTAQGQSNFFNSQGPTYNDIPKTLKNIEDLLTELRDHFIKE